MYKIKNKNLPNWKPKLFQMRASKHNVNYKKQITREMTVMNSDNAVH